VITRAQLLELGFSPKAIKHRLATGRLYCLFRGVYAVGRAEVTREGRWIAAVLACGDEAVLSHDSAAQLWGIRQAKAGPIHVLVPPRTACSKRGITVHRRQTPRKEIRRRDRIPLTSPLCTLIDLAATLGRDPLEAAVNEADKLGLIDPDALRQGLEPLAPRPGVATLRTTLDRRTFTLTRSQLERIFVPLARKVGLDMPLTQVEVNGYAVDFYWPDLGLVVETDGLTYHRTPAQQARDRLRDQAHAAAGLTPLRFIHAQVKFERPHVEHTLGAVADRLRRR
jgi:very-short-patch-repair endonuclease